MSELPNPIREALRDGGSELGAQRVWSRLSKSLDRPRRQRPTRAVVLALACLALALGGLWAFSSRAPETPGPLMADGRALDERHLAALQRANTELVLSDGSHLRSLQPSELEILENSAHVFSVFLHRGEIEFDIPPGGPRRWTIETGLVTVEVVGTKFIVARSETGVRVSVERGVVLVRGERVLNRVRRLEHGQTFELTSPQELEEVRVEPTAIEQPTPALKKRAITPPPPLELVADAGAPALDTGPSAEELFALADVARVSGHPYEAIGVLNRLIDAHPDDAMAPVAAFTIGKIQLEQLEAFDDASLSFERANLLGLPEALREQAFVRWIEALRRAHNLTRCREVAGQYRSLFPNARYVGAAQRCGAE